MCRCTTDTREFSICLAEPRQRVALVPYELRDPLHCSGEVACQGDAVLICTQLRQPLKVFRLFPFHCSASTPGRVRMASFSGRTPASPVFPTWASSSSGCRTLQAPLLAWLPTPSRSSSPLSLLSLLSAFFESPMWSPPVGRPAAGASLRLRGYPGITGPYCKAS